VMLTSGPGKSSSRMFGRKDAHPDTESVARATISHLTTVGSRTLGKYRT